MDILNWILALMSMVGKSSCLMSTCLCAFMSFCCAAFCALMKFSVFWGLHCEKKSVHINWRLEEKILRVELSYYYREWPQLKWEMVISLVSKLLTMVGGMCNKYPYLYNYVLSCFFPHSLLVIQSGMKKHPFILRLWCLYGEGSWGEKRGWEAEKAAKRIKICNFSWSFWIFLCLELNSQVQ